jgi:hypothetical protein
MYCAVLGRRRRIKCHSEIADSPMEVAYHFLDHQSISKVAPNIGVTGADEGDPNRTEQALVSEGSAAPDVLDRRALLYLKRRF